MKAALPIASFIILASCAGAALWSLGTQAQAPGPRFVAPSAPTSRPNIAAANGPQAGITRRDARTVELLSPIYLIDRKYPSMKGPSSSQSYHLIEPSPQPELLWITAYMTEMVGPDGRSPLPPEFMCHSNLELKPSEHQRLFGAKKLVSGRLFTLSQGQLDVAFPQGFAIPLLSSESLSLTTQVLNLNFEGPALAVRHKVVTRFTRDRDLTTPMQPLFMKAATGLVALGDQEAHYNIEKGDTDRHGKECMVGQTAGSGIYKDRYGRSFSGHWVVPPGRHVYHTNVTQYLQIPYDTTAHHIAVHLHPFAESLELIDLTAKQSLFKSRTRNSKGKIGLDHVDALASVAGIPLFQDHEYELIAVYDNTSGAHHDSMAVMFIYMLDKEFDRKKIQGL